MNVANPVALGLVAAAATGALASACLIVGRLTSRARRAAPETAHRLTRIGLWLQQHISQVPQLPALHRPLAARRTLPANYRPVCDQYLLNLIVDGWDIRSPEGDPYTGHLLDARTDINRAYDRLTATPRRRQDH